MFMQNAKPLAWACWPVSEPRLVLVLCHLLADRQLPKVSENGMEDIFIYLNIFKELNKNIMVLTAAPPPC